MLFGIDKLFTTALSESSFYVEITQKKLGLSNFFYISLKLKENNFLLLYYL